MPEVSAIQGFLTKQHDLGKSKLSSLGLQYSATFGIKYRPPICQTAKVLRQPSREIPNFLSPTGLVGAHAPVYYTLRTGEGVDMVPAHFHWCRSVLMNPFLILWAFHLTLDRMKPDDMRFLYTWSSGAMMQNYLDFKRKHPCLESVWSVLA